MSKLSERIETYSSISDYKLMSKLPIVICINGANFSKATQLLDKPYCIKFAECMSSTMLQLCSFVEGVVFSYQHNDEIIVIARNDQHVDTGIWYNGNIQKICSIVSSATTMFFHLCSMAKSLNMSGDPIFTSQVFTVPNISEACNTIIYKQQQNFHTSIQSACLYNLLNNHDKNTIKDMLAGLNVDDKIHLLEQECGVKYGDYPLSFRRGVAAYKVPKIIDGVMKPKWSVNNELTIFTKDQNFLSNIMHSGSDIFRG